MENINIEKKSAPIKNWQFWILIFFSCAGMFLVGYQYNKALEKERQEHAKTQEILNKEHLSKTSCITTKDSLFRENKRLSVYKALTLAMVYRDESTNSLKYKPGNLAYMKLDSSVVLIKDILIGGSTYNYYIKYKVQRKDKSIEDINPEEIY